MIKTKALLCILLFANFAIAQQITCSVKDSVAVENKIKEVNALPSNDAKTVAIGKTFLGTPYVAKTLEVGTEESLVINLQGLDCTTFVENVLAFSVLQKNNENTFNDFTKTLETIRYKNGKLTDYSSRLHYFTDWIRDNQNKGLVVDVTNELGGSVVKKEINFMSSHRNLYPFLKDNDENYAQVKQVEQKLNEEAMCVLLQEDIAANEHLIKSGDIIALTTTIKGLDVTHTGIATREKDGRIHLLHASTTGQVKISKMPLVDYLKKIKHNTGIMVARVSNN